MVDSRSRFSSASFLKFIDFNQGYFNLTSFPLSSTQNELFADVGIKSKVVLSQLPKCAAHAFALSFGAMPARGHACPASTGGTEASASDLRL